MCQVNFLKIILKIKIYNLKNGQKCKYHTNDFYVDYILKC